MYSREEIIKYTDEISKFMVENGFTVEEANDKLKSWYDDPCGIIFHETPSYWYYNFIINENDLECLDWKFHSNIYHNENKIKESTNVGCIKCNKIYAADLIKFDEPGEYVQTAVCPYCNMNTVIGDFYYKKKSLLWFKKSCRFFDEYLGYSLKIV